MGTISNPSFLFLPQKHLYNLNFRRMRAQPVNEGSISRNYAILDKIRGNRIVKSLSGALFVLYLLILIWLVLFKLSFDLPAVFDSQIRSVNLIPFAFINERGNVREILYNCAAFIPFGLLLSVNFKSVDLWRKLIIVFVFSLASEIAQFAFAIGATDITDLIANTFGGFIGFVLYGLSSKRIDDEKLDRLIVSIGTVLLLLFVLLRVLFLNVRYQSAH